MRKENFGLLNCLKITLLLLVLQEFFCMDLSQVVLIRSSAERVRSIPVIVQQCCSARTRGSNEKASAMFRPSSCASAFLAFNQLGATQVTVDKTPLMKFLFRLLNLCSRSRNWPPFKDTATFFESLRAVAVGSKRLLKGPLRQVPC